jgi:formylglycine-generating enzyme required for sulfatase activity
LLAASGYANRPKEFDELIRILDSEIRLITPTDPEGQEKETVSVQTGGKYYQLTHDYLVHSLRDWLTRKQKETRRGRAELRLGERAAAWNSKPENRHLPAWWEWATIRLYTHKGAWTPPQRRLMGRAGRYHAMRGGLLVLALVVLTFAGWWTRGAMEARRGVENLLTAKTTDALDIVHGLEPYRRWATPLLREAFAEAKRDGNQRRQLHASFALVAVDSEQVKYLQGRLLHGDPEEVLVIGQALLDHRQELTAGLWELLENAARDSDQRFRAACALAAFAPDDPRWERVRDDVAGKLAAQKPFEMARWTEVLKPMRKALLTPLASFLEDEKRSPSERELIANIYGNYAADVPEAYAQLEKRLADESAPDASAEKKLELTKRQANIGVGLLVMDRGEKVWPLLKHSPDPTLRSYLIERFAPGGVAAEILLKRLDQENDDSIRRALLLSLGEYGLDRLQPAGRQNLLIRILDLYRNDPDPGIHGAARWLLKKWGDAAKVKEIDEASRIASAPGVKRGWSVSSQGQTMVVIPKPLEGVFWMGEGEKRQFWLRVGEKRHQQPMGYNFVLSTETVTVEQFQRFRAKYITAREHAPTRECPALGVSWYDAAAYCNWLSQREEIAEAQWCYEIQRGAVPALAASTVGLLGSSWGPRPLLAAALVFPERTDQDDRYGNQTKIKAGYLGLKGYRLPTEAEWEYACRAGSQARYSFGESAELLDRYGWSNRTSLGQAHPVALLKPNDLGLFDMSGNVWQWLQNGYDDKTFDRGESVTGASSRATRGGCWNSGAGDCRAACRHRSSPEFGYYQLGFRLARVPVEGK